MFTFLQILQCKTSPLIVRTSGYSAIRFLIALTPSLGYFDPTKVCYIFMYECIFANCKIEFDCFFYFWMYLDFVTYSSICITLYGVLLRGVSAASGSLRAWASGGWSTNRLISLLCPWSTSSVSIWSCKATQLIQWFIHLVENLKIIDLIKGRSNKHVEFIL